MSIAVKYVGLDVSKDKIVIAIADEGRDTPRYWGSIPHTKEAVRKLVGQLTKEGDVKLDVCYEAGPTGFDLRRWFLEFFVDCSVVAPTAALTRNTRIKTDKKDAIRLAQLWRARELTAIYVPKPEDEALRDLVRAREDAVEDQNRSRQRLMKFLLRHQLLLPQGKRPWSFAHEEWLDTLRFERACEDIVFQEYRNNIREAVQRIQRYEQEMEKQATSSCQSPMIKALQALRGVALITATTLAAELGDIAGRFPHPGLLMSYSGLVPSEHSSGASRWQGGITKAGNAHIRRVLIEAAWSYRHSPAVRRALRERLNGLSPEIQEISWNAQKRLNRKYKHLSAKGKHKGTITAAVARELLGFIWAIAKEIDKQKQATASV
ncbi:IS110 family transposase [Paenibacillus sp. SI8]|uniref:IS110 family transposase n=1 Tax=unclassified Paenibacillus TaxID=185978 RepID=UPI003465F8A0